jgi:hypothetical protein
MFVFKEDSGKSTGYVDGTDAIIPEITGIVDAPIAPNFLCGTSKMGMFKNSDNRSRQIATVGTTGRTTSMYPALWSMVSMSAFLSISSSMVGVINRYYLDRRNAIVPIMVTSTGPFATYNQVIAFKMSMFKKDGFVAAGNDD